MNKLSYLESKFSTCGFVPAAYQERRGDDEIGIPDWYIFPE
jgi:hypothetical protein